MKTMIEAFKNGCKKKYFKCNGLRVVMIVNTLHGSKQR